MRPRDLLETAVILLLSSNGRPTTASLCRALSSTYYALFHCLAYECANLLIGGTKSLRSEPAWRQVYRSLNHGFASGKCTQTDNLKKFPKEIEDFATTFVTMQRKRHSADYDPLYRVLKSEVAADIALSKDAIQKFCAAPVKHRRAFCAYVLFGDRK